MAKGDRHAIWALKLMLDNLEKKGMKFEALYFDGHSGYQGHAVP